MRELVLALLVAIPAFAYQASSPKTGRDYYNELKNAHGLDRYGDVYVCLADDDEPSFAVVARGSDVIKEMQSVGEKPDKDTLPDKKLLVVQSYYKGVGNGVEMYEPVGDNGTDWQSITNVKGARFKLRYSINWDTGRYRFMVYALAKSSEIPASERSGKCELIHQKNR